MTACALPGYPASMMRGPAGIPAWIASRPRSGAGCAQEPASSCHPTWDRNRSRSSLRSVSQACADLEAFEHALHGALAQSEQVTDFAAGMPGCFQLEDYSLLVGK